MSNDPWADLTPDSVTQTDGDPWADLAPDEPDTYAPAPWSTTPPNYQPEPDAQDLISSVTPFVPRGISRNPRSILEEQVRNAGQPQKPEYSKRLQELSSIYGHGTTPDHARTIAREYAGLFENLVADFPEYAQLIEREIRKGHAPSTVLAIVRAEKKKDEDKRQMRARVEVKKQTRGITDPAQADAALMATAGIERLKAQLSVAVDPAERAALTDQLKQALGERVDTQALPTDTGQLFWEEAIPRGEAAGRAIAQTAIPSTAGGLGMVATARLAANASPVARVVAPLLVGGIAALGVGQAQNLMAKEVLGDEKYAEWVAQLSQDREKYPGTVFAAEQVGNLAVGRINPAMHKLALTGAQKVLAGEVAAVTQAEKQAIGSAAFGGSAGATLEFMRQIGEGQIRPLELAASFLINAGVNDMAGGRTPDVPLPRATDGVNVNLPESELMNVQGGALGRENLLPPPEVARGPEFVPPETFSGEGQRLTRKMEDLTTAVPLRPDLTVPDPMAGPVEPITGALTSRAPLRQDVISPLESPTQLDIGMSRGAVPVNTAIEKALQSTTPPRLVFLTKHGKRVEGVLESRKGSVLNIRDDSGKLTSIAQSRVESITPQATAKTLPPSTATEPLRISQPTATATTGREPTVMQPTVAAGKNTLTEPLKRESGFASKTGAIGTRATPTRPTNTGNAAVNKVNTILNKQDQDLANKVKPTFQRFRDKLFSLITDENYAVKNRLAKDGAADVERDLVLRQGANEEVNRQYMAASKDVYATVPHEMEQDFSDYLQAKRTVEVDDLMASRGETIKNPGGMTGDEARAKLAEIQARLNPRELASVETAANKYWANMRSQLDQLKDAGLISPESHATLIAEHKNYSPRAFIDKIDPYAGAAGGRTHDSGVKSLDEGSTGSLVNDPRYLLSQVVTRTQNRIFNNRANGTLFKFVDTTPGNALGAKVRGPADKEIPTGYEEVKWFDKGQEKSVLMPSEVARGWFKMPPVLRPDVAQAAQWLSGAKPVKALATGYNPEFALSNLARDMAYAWFRTNEYSPIAPVAFFQQLGDYGKVAGDAWKRKGRYVDYIKEGGGMETLSRQGLVSDPYNRETPFGEAANGVLKALNRFNEFSELLTRLAVRERAIKNGKSGVDATYTARNMLDFSQGGSLTKAGNNVVPYLNAMVQGTRGTLNTFRKNPAVATLKASQIVAISAGLAYAAKTMNKEVWDSISEQEKATKWIIPLPKAFAYKDTSGVQRYRYIAIPKDQGQQLFAALGIAIASKMSGQEEANGEILARAATSNMVTGDQAIPPIGQAYVALKNYDIFRGDEIWKGRDLPLSEERDATTSAGYEEFADMAKSIGLEVSPKRTERAVGKVLPPNPYSWMIGGLLNYATADQVGKDFNIDEVLKDAPIMRRFLRSTPPVDLSDDEVKKAKDAGIDSTKAARIVRKDVRAATQAENTVRQRHDNEAQRIVYKVLGKSEDLKALYAYARSVGNHEEAQRILRRLRDKYPKLNIQVPKDAP